MARLGTVEKGLSSKDLHKFCAHLASLPNLTLETMRAEAAKLGIELSHGAASRFKNGTFGRFLEKLAAVREFSQQIKALREGGSNISDAANEVLLEDIFAFVSKRADAEDKIELKDVKELVGIISKMRAGDHRERAADAREKLLEAQLAEYKRREAEWQRRDAEREEAKKRSLAALQSGGGLSDEALAKIESILGSL